MDVWQVVGIGAATPAAMLLADAAVGVSVNLSSVVGITTAAVGVATYVSRKFGRVDLAVERLHNNQKTIVKRLDYIVEHCKACPFNGGEAAKNLDLESPGMPGSSEGGK